MIRKPEISEKKRNLLTKLFVETTAYRIPLPVTKVIVYADNTSYPICPKCLQSLDREYVSFCDRCGQKLNWDLFDYARISYTHAKRK